jgi:lipoprotein-anchoring transpeptidase ErfK/SrfK
MATILLRIEQEKPPHLFSTVLYSLLFLFTLFITGCQPPKPSAQEITLEAKPLGKEVGQWQVVPTEKMTLTAIASDAKEVRFVYRPVTSVNHYAEIGKLTTTEGNGKFSITWTPGVDVTGDVWAEAVWADGTRKKSNILALASEDAISLGGNIPLDSIGNSAEINVSARSDTLTKGKITKAALIAGDSRIWITVDVPAFRLTLWQSGKEVQTYQIGVGRLNYPLPIGERKATEIIWNPDWIPPDSKWVTDVEPGEKIEADDPRNPLGKIKIRLGNAILIHEAAAPTDIGRLASHGCVRMLTDDLFDLTEKIVTARNLPVTKEQIEQAKGNTERLAVKLDPPIWVDVNYDTHVVEGGVLHLYPDVYNRAKDDLGDLRKTLSENGITQLDEDSLKQLLSRVSPKDGFVVSLADLKAGRAFERGKQVPLVDVIEQKPEA